MALATDENTITNHMFKTTFEFANMSNITRYPEQMELPMVTGKKYDYLYLIMFSSQRISCVKKL